MRSRGRPTSQTQYSASWNKNAGPARRPFRTRRARAREREIHRPHGPTGDCHGTAHPKCPSINRTLLHLCATTRAKSAHPTLRKKNKNTCKPVTCLYSSDFFRRGQGGGSAKLWARSSYPPHRERRSQPVAGRKPPVSTRRRPQAPESLLRRLEPPCRGLSAEPPQHGRVNAPRNGVHWGV